MGHNKEADIILYGSRERARDVAWSKGEYREWLGLSLLKLTIGYGFDYFRCLYWVAGFVALGFIVLRSTGQYLQSSGPIGFWYSLDVLLPIIRLRDQHYQIDLQGLARYYFFVHRVVGYVRASFFIAGLAGLAK